MLSSMEGRLRRFIGEMSANAMARNAFFLMASTFVSAGAGFLFWTFCSRLYTPHEVGLATTLIAATALVSTLSMLGLTNALIAHLPKRDSMELADTAIGMAGTASLVGGLIYVLVARQIDPNMSTYMASLWQQAVVVLYIVAQSISALTDSIFTAQRATWNIFLKNAVGSSVKLVLPWVFAGLAGFGIFTAVAFVTFVSVGISIYNLRKAGYRPRPEYSRAVFSGVRTYATHNYIGTIFGILPATLVPLIVSWMAGASEVAYLYIALTVSQLLNVIPSATSQSFFAEAAHAQESLGTLVGRALRHIYALLIPAVTLILLAGELLLKIFGESYAENSLKLLQLLAVSSLFGVVNYLGDTYLNVRHQTRAYIAMNALNAVLVVGLAAIGMHRHGLWGVGLGWLYGQVITNVAYGGLIWARRRQAKTAANPAS